MKGYFSDEGKKKGMARGEDNTLDDSFLKDDKLIRGGASFFGGGTTLCLKYFWDCALQKEDRSRIQKKPENLKGAVI